MSSDMNGTAAGGSRITKRRYRGMTAATQRRGGFGGPGGGRRGGPGGFMNPIERAHDKKGTLIRLLKYMGRQGWGFFFVLITVALTSVLNLLSPAMLGSAIDAIAAGDMQALGIVILKLAAIYISSSIVTYAQQFVMAGVSQRITRDIRKDLFAKLQKLPIKYFDGEEAGNVMSRFTNDVDTISMTIGNSATQIISSIITIVGAVYYMIYYSWELTLIGFIVVPVGMFLTTKIAKRSRKLFVAQQATLGELNGIIQETITGQKTVKAYNREKFIIEEFDEVNAEMRQVGIKAQIFAGLIPPLFGFLNNFSYALCAAFAGWFAILGKISIGGISAFLNYLRQFSRPINQIANQYNSIQSGLAGAERVFQVMDQDEYTPDLPDAKEITDVKGDVEFENVDFSYVEGVPVLKKINIHAQPGETIALVGPTGAGKTTVINLLMRFYDINSGSIRLDGTDIRELKRSNLRSLLGIVLQDSYLFGDTVMANIRYGRLDATDEEVYRAAKLANADTFIERLPDGYETMLTGEGTNLSQGQRQLISIARAILADPSILILDEATSSVDTRTEMHIQSAMLALMQGRTSFVIAHRLSTIRDAHDILVVNHGEIIEHGTHEQLIEQKGFYYNLYMSQFKNEQEDLPEEEEKTQMPMRPRGQMDFGGPGMGNMFR